MTGLFYEPVFLEHRTGPGHPERPERLSAILAELERAPLVGLERRGCRPATGAELALAHPSSFVERLLALDGRSGALDADTHLSARSIEAARVAAGAGLLAVEGVVRGELRNAFALVRPPGHHAEPQRSMGFCLFNNIAIAAEHARALGVERVAVLDWDVHHGNGTQRAFFDRSDVLFLSSHQSPFYPGTGAAEEVGHGPGAGFTVNCPLPAGMGDADYGAVFHELFLPVLSEFRPGLILVSAGFDAHASDPLADMRVSERGFSAMASATAELAREVCGGKVVAFLEGGYDLEALSASTHACLEVLSQGRKDSFPSSVSSSARTAIAQTRQAHLGYWSSLRQGL
jgi:acetoin utilization deacetylase AcuC-like enzyme